MNQTQSKTDKPALHVAFGVDRSYLPPMGAAIASIARANPELAIIFHVMATGFSSSDKDELTRFAQRQGMDIRCHDVDDVLLARLPDPDAYTRAIYNRFLICDALAGIASKVLYLDADIICTGKLAELVSLDMEGKVVAAVPDVEQERRKQAAGLPENAVYFNSGVLYIDVEKWNERGLTNILIKTLAENYGRFSMLDQDALNVVLAETVLLLPRKWNVLIDHFPVGGDTVFIHYAGGKPWQEWSQTYQEPRFAKALAATPWASWRYVPLNRKQRNKQAQHLIRRGRIFAALRAYALFMGTPKKLNNRALAHQNRTGALQPLPGLGDMIWLLPALRAIAATSEGSSLTLLAKSSALAGPLLADDPAFTSILTLPHKRGMAGLFTNLAETWLTLRRARLKRLFVLHHSPRYRVLAYLAGIREVIAYPPKLAESSANGWEKSLTLLGWLGIAVPDRHSYLIRQPAQTAAARQKFAAYPRPWVIVAPGASEPARRWPLDYFAQVADALIEAHGGTIFLTGAPNEAEIVARAHALCRHRGQIIPTVGLDFACFLGLITESEGLLGNDSGPANVAAALGVPAFVLCGTSTPALHSPHLHLIMPDLPPERAQGMEAISVDGVLNFMRDKI
ncbi:MAG: hypothetical protein KGI37_02320 [Alphaproteobacteria bacterium]|nr:hypothetical protein [Alphaproteobacteria bacterium]